MKAFTAFCRKQLRYVEELEYLWLELPEPPIDTPSFIVEQVRDRAARLGLAALVDAARDADLDAVRVYLARAMAETTVAEPGDWLTVKQAADRLNVSARTVYDLCEMGRLRCQRVGIGRGTIRIRPADLEGCLAKPGPAIYRHLTI